MAKKAKQKPPKKALSSEDLKRARAVAAGLEASFTEPSPPGALAPAPLLDEIRELGEAGVAGMLDHLASTSAEGRLPSLASIRALGDPAATPGLLSHARSLRWSAEELAALGEAIRALDPHADLPPELDGDALARARGAAERLGGGEALSPEAAEEVSDLLLSFPPRLREIALHEAFETRGEDRPEGARAANVLALAGAVEARGVPPPAVLIDALASLATPEAARALTGLAEAAPEKETTSRVRKALYRLRNEGVVVEEPGEKGEGDGARAGAPPLDCARALVSAVDGRGRMLVWLGRSRQPRGRYVFQVRLRHGRGIEDFTSADLSAKEMRDLFARIVEQASLAAAEVPTGYAIWLLQRAQREHEGEGPSLPAGFTRSKLLLGPLADPGAFPPEGPHPVRALVRPVPSGEPRVEPRELFSQTAFWTWVVDEERMISPFKAFLESLQSKVALNEAQRRERLDRIVEGAAEELFRDAALRERLGAQLEDNAYLFHRAGRDEVARECLILADEMKAGGDPPAFFIEMVHFSMGVMLERLLRQSKADQAGEGGPAAEPDGPEGGRGEEAGEEGPSVIVTP